MEADFENPYQTIVNYITPVPKLEDLAILNIVTSLWKQTDIKEEMKKCTSRYNSINYDGSKLESKTEVIKKVFEKLQFLSLPNLLKAKLSNFIAPIGFQLLEWIDYSEISYFHFHNSIDYIDTVCWTVEGKIDKAKTLKLQCTKHNLERNINQVYKLACKYCLKNLIPKLWNLLSENSKESISNGIVDGEYDLLVLFWTCFIREEWLVFYNMIKLHYSHIFDIQTVTDCKHKVYLIMFEISLSGYNLAVKYFWNYLSSEERNNIEVWADDAADYRKHVIEKKAYYQNTNVYMDILCFLLPKIYKKEWLKNFLFNFKFDILTWLCMDWQWQKFLLPTLQMMWDFDNGQSFFLLLSSHARELGSKLITELWYSCPINCKKYFFQPCNEHLRVNVILSLLEIKGCVENVKLILNYVNTEEKISTIFETITNAEMLCQVINGHNSSLLDNLAAILPSVSVINQYKLKVLKSIGGRLCYNWLCSNDWQAMKKFFDWSFSSQDIIDNDVIELANKVVLKSLVRLKNYEVADKFVNLCFNSEEKIKLLKIKLIYYKNFKIVKKMKNFKSFKNLVEWCFSSDCDINQFKMDILKNKITKYTEFLPLSCILIPVLHEYNEMQLIIYGMITSEYKFESVNKLFIWCFDSKERIQEFKNKFAVSQVGKILIKAVYSHGVTFKDYIEWLSPLERDIIHMLEKETPKHLSYPSGLEQLRKELSNLLIRIKKFNNSIDQNGILMYERIYNSNNN